MKKKIIIIIFIVLVLFLSFLIYNFLINKKVHIIQDKLINIGNLNFAEIPRLYEGTLTFENIRNKEQHEYFVCLDDTSMVKLNAIYDLPSNYYVPHGGPNESMETNGCNRSLYYNNSLNKK